MNVQICKVVCIECPFKKQNVHLLDKRMIKNMLKKDIVSPCHMDLEQFDGCTSNKGVEIYAEVAKEFKVCRGLVEARLLAGIPSVSPVWKYLEAEFDKGELCGDIVDLREIL